MMEDPDKAVERLLAGLRVVEPPVGMERRIVAALERHEASPSQASIWPRWLEHAFSRRFLICGVALSAAVAVFFALSVTHRHGSPPASVTGRTSPLPKRPRAASTFISERRAPPITELSINKPRPQTVTHGAARNVAALRTTREAGFPAPPMPLTAQEKLLLQLAHRGDPEQLAMLTQHVAVQSEEEKRDVTDFFGQPDKGDHE